MQRIILTKGQWMLVFFSCLGLGLWLVTPPTQAAAEQCTDFGSVYWYDQAGTRLSLNTQVLVGDTLQAVAETDNSSNPIMGANKVDCQGVTVNFKLCNDGRSCTEAGENLGTAVFDSNGRAIVSWVARPGTTTNEFVFSATLPAGRTRTAPRIKVISDTSQGSCRINKVSGSITGTLVTANADTLGQCQKETVRFKLCRLSAGGKADLNECFQTLGTQPISSQQTQVTTTLATEYINRTDVKIFIAAQLTSGGDPVFSSPFDISAQAGRNPPAGGEPINYRLNLTNPLKGKPTSLAGLIGIISTFVLNLGIALSVLIILYAGFLMLVSSGNPELYKKGTHALRWAVIGFAVLLISKGLVALIQSILSVK